MNTVPLQKAEGEGPYVYSERNHPNEGEKLSSGKYRLFLVCIRRVVLRFGCTLFSEGSALSEALDDKHLDIDAQPQKTLN